MLIAIAIGISTMTRVLNWLESHVMAMSPSTARVSIRPATPVVPLHDPVVQSA